MPRSFRTIQVSEVMVNSVVTVSSGDSLQHALSLLEKYQVHELPVLEQGRLIGIVTGGDLKFFTPAFPLLPDLEELRQTLRELTVAAAMTLEPVSTTPQATLLEAITLMYKHHVSALLVTEGETLLGILSVSDILRILIEQHDV
jgi:acetoin utilization protein AcuB